MPLIFEIISFEKLDLNNYYIMNNYDNYNNYSFKFIKFIINISFSKIIDKYKIYLYLFQYINILNN